MEAIGIRRGCEECTFSTHTYTHTRPYQLILRSHRQHTLSMLSHAPSYSHMATTHTSLSLPLTSYSRWLAVDVALSKPSQGNGSKVRMIRSDGRKDLGRHGQRPRRPDSPLSNTHLAVTRYRPPPLFTCEVCVCVFVSLEPQHSNQ